MNGLLKKIRYLIEAVIVKLGLGFFEILGPQRASNVGSFLARTIGKKHSTHKLAMRNISKALPHLSEAEKEKILDDMWDNLGRVVGEYIHIVKVTPQELVEKYITFDQTTIDNLNFLKQNKKGGIIFSAHTGNWEVGPKTFMSEGFNVSTVYRPLNNPYVEKMTASIRGSKLIAKGPQGNRQIIEAVKKGEYIIILADQKISEGELVQFFHDSAVTTTSLARISLKYDIPLIPARSIRINHHCKFKVEIERPLAFQKTDDINKDVMSLTRLVNCKLEEWITQYPAQWFWVHDRWKK